MDGWNTSFLLGWPIFRLVSGAICIKLNVQLVPYYSADFDEFNELPAVNPSAQKSHPSYVTIWFVRWGRSLGHKWLIYHPLWAPPPFDSQFFVFLRLHHLLFRTVSTAEEKSFLSTFPTTFCSAASQSIFLAGVFKNCFIGISMFQLVSTIPKWRTQQPLFFCPMVWMASIRIVERPAGCWSPDWWKCSWTFRGKPGGEEQQSLAMFQTLGGYIKIHQSFNDLSQIFGGDNFLGIQT